MFPHYRVSAKIISCDNLLCYSRADLKNVEVLNKTYLMKHVQVIVKSGLVRLAEISSLQL